MAERNIAKIDLLKIDTEGAEHLVLRGFGDNLSPDRIPVIQFEYGLINISAKFLLRDFYAFFEARGYQVGKLMPAGVRFRSYQFEDEDFIGPNYVAAAPEAVRFWRKAGLRSADFPLFLPPNTTGFVNLGKIAPRLPSCALYWPDVPRRRPSRPTRRPRYMVIADFTPFYRLGPMQARGPDATLRAETRVKLLRKEMGYSLDPVGGFPHRLHPQREHGRGPASPPEPKPSILTDDSGPRKRAVAAPPARSIAGNS